MVLSRNYIIRLAIGWVLLGALFFCIGLGYIGGVATLFLFAAFASWTIFPAIHFAVAAFVARKYQRDPSSVVLISLVISLLIIIFGAWEAGFFSYV